MLDRMIKSAEAPTNAEEEMPAGLAEQLEESDAKAGWAVNDINSMHDLLKQLPRKVRRKMMNKSSFSNTFKKAIIK